MGTPATKLSRVEFHPLCVKNPPMALCASTSSCGAHPTMNPLSLVPSSNSAATRSSLSFPATISGRITHKNLFLLFTKPYQNSISLSLVTVAMLPKLTYSTDFNG
ncbi:hypothetical protein V8G54_014389 [Vigna mungo]|uniref:Uncharacterized protein n=1 Tax=Vigna mungo TaxID=3915 RepID=A0AAQ3RZD8_VIGMU